MDVKEVISALRRNDTGKLLPFREKILVDVELALKFCEALSVLTHSAQRSDKRAAVREKGKIDIVVQKNISSITPHFVSRLALRYCQETEKNTKMLFPGIMLLDTKEGDLVSSKHILRALIDALGGLFMPIWEDDHLPSKALQHFYILYCWGLPYTHIWPCLLAGCRDNDQEAKELVSRFLNLAYFSDHIHSFYYQEMDIIHQLPLEAWEQICLEVFRREALPLVYGENDIWLIGPCMAEIDAKVKQMIATFAEIKTFIQDNAESLTKRYHEMWREIKEEPKYGVRSQGADRVKINMQQVNQSGFVLKGVQFVAEKHEFPEVGVKMYFSLNGVESEYELTLRENLFLDNITRERMHFSNYLTILVTYCYWRIITGKDRVLYDYCDEHKVSSKLKPGKGGEVRPHRRQLRPGHHVSQTALYNAKLQYKNKRPLLPGETFVVKHKRHRGKCQSIQPKPLFVVNEGDMLIHEEKVLV